MREGTEEFLAPAQSDLRLTSILPPRSFWCWTSNFGYSLSRDDSLFWIGVLFWVSCRGPLRSCAWRISCSTVMAAKTTSTHLHQRVCMARSRGISIFDVSAGGSVGRWIGVRRFMRSGNGGSHAKLDKHPGAGRGQVFSGCTCCWNVGSTTRWWRLLWRRHSVVARAGSF